jgi:hypothetical protein
VTNPDGWVGFGLHEVDGYWVTAEYKCDNSDYFCSMATEASIVAMHYEDVGAKVTSVMSTALPERSPSEGLSTVAGLQRPRLMVVYLADGTKRVIGLMCGAVSHARNEVQQGCRRASLDGYRVGMGRPARDAPPLN